MENASGARELGLLASAPDECLVFDLQGRVVAANDAALRALGCSLDELLGRRARELLTCLGTHGFEHALEAVRSEGPQSLLGHLRRRDGGLIATETRLWLAQDGAETLVFALAREMRGSQGLIEERDQLVHLLEASSDFVLLFDDELHLTYANRAALEQLGFERAEDAHGLGLPELVVPEQRAHVEETVVPRLARDGWDGELELRSWRSRAVRTPCWVHAFAVRHSRTRKRVGYALSARDVSARRVAEQRRDRLLRLAEVSRRVALHLLREEDLGAAVGVILDGVGRILGVARAYLHRFREDGRWLLRTHEWSPEHGVRHRADAPADVGENYRWATEVLARGEALRIDEAGAQPDERRGLLFSGERALLLLPMRIHGRLESVFGFVHDRGHPWEDDEVAAVQLIVDAFAHGIERRIAERERQEVRAQLEQALERERVANHFKSEFLAHLSHELRTPMNAIRGYAELLARPNPEPALRVQWIQNLRRSTEYLLGLVHDVLDLSKIEAGHMQLERAPAKLAEILAGVEDLLTAGAREKGLELALRLEGELPETFETDAVRVQQILVNLVGNALKFTQRGSVTVSARVRTLDDRRPALEIAVADTGIGIPGEALDKLFRAFSQVNQSQGGTGLGLQISRSLARLLGGDISVTSELGKGSTFTLTLPLENPSGVLRALPERGAQAAPAAGAAPAVLANKRFLVVDDSLENRDVLRFLLQEAGASSESAVNGQLGVERALAAQKAGAPFDAVLMDMNMPVMDGFAATRALAKAGVTSPVVALTALALAGDEERCREAGCVAYVVKPIVPAAFFETLARSLRSARERPRVAQASADAPDKRKDGASGEGTLLSLAQHPRFRGLVERYVASFPQLAERMRYLVRTGELEELRTLVHRLRGTAASYGFPGVSQAAGSCEDAIRAGATPAEVARLLEELLGRLTLAAAG